MAPEILDCKFETLPEGYSYEVDIWALGVIIYSIIIGKVKFLFFIFLKPPYEMPSIDKTYTKIRMNSYSFPEDIPISD